MMDETYCETGTYPKIGDKVLIVKLKPTTGFIVQQSTLEYRQCPAKGEIITIVPGHGGDVWGIEHADGTNAVYSVCEMMPDDQPEESEAE